MIEKPYGSGEYRPHPLGRVVTYHFARSAESFRADIEAYLVERGLTTELTDTVISLLDHPVTSAFYGESLECVVDALEQCLDND